MNSGVSASTGAVDFVFWFIVGISIFLMVLITFLMVFFVIKYNKKRNKKAKDIHGNTTLEIVWTVIPTILVLAMFYFGWKGYAFIRKVPPDAMNVDVTAQMWHWSFTYPNGAQTDTLIVPVGKSVKLNLNSRDVIHSFYIPAFRIKEDVVPGLNNYLWFQADEEGSYDVLCAEYCGLRHSYMLTKVNAVPEEDFQSWYVALEVPSEAPADTSQQVSEEQLAKEGERLVQVKGCMACHSTDGTIKVGPSFKGLYGHKVTVTENGSEKEIVADDAYIKRSMLEPKADIVKGFQPLMPSQQGQLSDQQIKAIISYIKELK